MASKAAKRRAKLQARQIAPQPPRAQKATTDAKPKRKSPHDALSGIEWLYHKQKITKRQANAGIRYGVDYRRAAIHGHNPIRSCINDSPRGGDGVGLPPRAVQDAEAVDALDQARQALSHEQMVQTCDAICGAQQTPWQIVKANKGNQKDADRILTILTLALDILDRHYSDVRQGQRAA